MLGYKWGLVLVALSCWTPAAIADASASAVAASAVKAVPSPEENYQAGLKADEAGEIIDAIRLFKLAADAGHATALARIGDIFKSGSQYRAAFESYEKSAAQGDAHGQFGLGLMYTVVGESQNFEEARRWVIMSAEQKYSPAILAMSGAYTVGGMGLDEAARNSPEALKWIQRAADINHIPALRMLADAYRTGKYGLAVDLQRAAEWDDKVRELGGMKDEKKKKQTRRR